MKVKFNRRQCLQLSALVLTGLFCASTASAADLVSAVPSNYSRSEIGTVTGSRVTTEVNATPNKGVVTGKKQAFPAPVHLQHNRLKTQQNLGSELLWSRSC